MHRRTGSVLLAASLLATLVPSTGATALDSEDERRSQMWWFDQIGVEDAWDTSQGEGIVVAVLDTGVDMTHPDLQGQFATNADGTVGRDLVDRDDESPTGDGPSDPNGHGTIVAGLVAALANNEEGIAGVAPRARIMPVRVLGADGRGQAGVVDAGIRWAVDNGADVINLSLEVEETEDGPDPEFTAPNDAIEYAWENGVVVVAATGNSGGGAVGYREDSPVLLVGATDREDELAPFSDAGRLDAVMAPGEEMVSTWCRPTPQGCDPDDRYGIGAGTSFAAPVTAGLAALLLGAGLDAAATVRTIRETAVDLGDPGPDATFGTGRVDAAAALAAAVAPPPAPTEEPTSPAPSPAASPEPPDTSAAGDGSEAPDRAPPDVPVVDPAPAAPGEGGGLFDLAGPAFDLGEPGEPPVALVALAAALTAAAGVATAREARRRR